MAKRKLCLREQYLTANDDNTNEETKYFQHARVFNFHVNILTRRKNNKGLY